MIKSTFIRTLLAAIAAAFLTTQVIAAPDETPAAPAKSASEKQYDRAVKFIEQDKFKRAVPLLKKVVKAEPQNANAWNWLGFASRNMQDLETSEMAYARALEIDPKHKGALEYQGELKLMQKDLKGAEANLAKLVALCPTGCDELDDLKKDIAAYKAANPSSS